MQLYAAKGVQEYLSIILVMELHAYPRAKQTESRVMCR